MNRTVKGFTQYFLPLALFALAVFHVGFLIFKVVTFYPDDIHSDAAVAPLLAAEVLKSGQIIPDGWYHANSDIWLFSRHFLILPFIPIFGLGQASYLAMQLTYIVLLAASAVWSLKPVLHKPSHIFIAVSLLAIPFSTRYYSFVYGEIAYGTYLLHIMLVTGLLARAILSQSRRTLYLVLLLVLCLLFATANPSRYIAYMLVPALAVLYLFHDQKNRLVGVGIALVAVLFIGRSLHQLWTTDLYLSTAGKRYGIDNPLSWPGSILKTAVEMFTIVDLDAFTNSHGIISFGYSAVVLIASLSAVVVLMLRLQRMRGTGRVLTFKWGYCYALLIFYLVSIVCICGAFIVTSAPILNRILIPPYFLALLLLFAIFLPHAFRDWRIGVVYLVFMSVPTGFAMMSNRTDSPSLERQLEIARQIETLGLKHGYSTDFWHANVTTLVTDEAVFIRAVDHEDRLFQPRRWLSHRDWYVPQAKGRFFVLAGLDQELDFGTLSHFGISHVETTQVDEMALHVFDGHENLVKLPTWNGNDRVLSGHPLLSSTEVGSIEEDTKGVYLVNSEPGLLARGRFLPLRKGEYTLEVSVDCSEGAQASVELLSYPDRVQASLGEICEGSTEQLPFSSGRNLRDASIQITVQKGTVRYYGSQVR